MEDSSEDTVRKIKKSEAYDSRCYGLQAGVAYLVDLKTNVSASYVNKSAGPFYCRECLSEAIVRKCTDKDDHFAHKARLSPTGRRGNTDFHHAVRDELCAVLQRQFPDGNWQLEVEMKKPAKEINLRADIAGYFGRREPGFAPVAIEVQCSPYSPSYIRKKTADYEKLGVHVVWIVPLTANLGESEFRPRRYELYLHTMYLGYIFYYEPSNKGILTPVHYGPAFRYIEQKTFHDTGANEVNTGDYYLKYKTLKCPDYGEPVALQDLISKSLSAWVNPNNKKLSVPSRKIMALKQYKWWPKDENKEWLKNNDWYRYVKEYLPYYNPDDVNDEYEE